MMNKKRTFRVGMFGYLLLLPITFLLISSVDVQATLRLNSSFVNGFVNDTTGQIVTGKVMDEGGKPLEGAVVLIKDRSIGCRTDCKGRFSIKASSNDILLFSYVGKEIRSIPVTQRKIMKVRLHNSVLVLEDSHPISCLKPWKSRLPMLFLFWLRRKSIRYYRPSFLVVKSMILTG